MKFLSTLFAFILLTFAVTANAEDPDGFRGFTWGSTIDVMKESDSRLVESQMGAMPGVKAYKRTEEDLNYGGIKADSIVYTFYKERLTSVSIDFRGFDNYERLLEFCKIQFGTVTGTAVLRLEQYSSFDSPKTGAMLLYQLSMQTTNYGRLYIYSKEYLQ
jgi:hypothetical protein